MIENQIRENLQELILSFESVERHKFPSLSELQILYTHEAGMGICRN